MGKSKKHGNRNEQIYDEIEMLDRGWNNEMPNYMVKGTLPTTNGVLTSFMGLLVIIFGIAWTIAASSMSPTFALFGIIFVIGGIWSLINHNNRRGKFLDAKDRYERKRAGLQRRLKK